MSNLISWLGVSTLRRNHLKGQDGSCIKGALAAAGYNFSLLLRWFEKLLHAQLSTLCRGLPPPAPRPAQPSETFFTSDLPGIPISNGNPIRSQQLTEACGWEVSVVLRPRL